MRLLAIKIEDQLKCQVNVGPGILFNSCFDHIEAMREGEVLKHIKLEVTTSFNFVFVMLSLKIKA